MSDKPTAREIVAGLLPTFIECYENPIRVTLPSHNKLLAVADGILSALAAVGFVQANWQPISTAPKDRMFIWAAPNGPGKWSVGLAYQTVSKTWRDAYANPDAPAKATLWAEMPVPPRE